jgi:nitrate/nitrite transporter NarK
VILFWFFSHSDPAHLVPSHLTFRDQLKSLKDPKVIKYCQYYSIVFGGYVALVTCGWCSITWVNLAWTFAQPLCWPPAFHCLAACCARWAAGCQTNMALTAMTWWVLWVSWICLFLLSYPQTDFTIATTRPQNLSHWSERLHVHCPDVHVLGIAWAFGKASVFKYISDDYPHNIGTISGIVGLAGGLGGFLLPIMFGALMDVTGIRSSAFMLMYGVVWVSLIWMYWTEVRAKDLHGPQEPTCDQCTNFFLMKDLMNQSTSSRNDIADWRPEDTKFWERTGKKIAYRNLWISIPNLLCGFAVWGMWGIITVQMLNLGFPFTQAELFTLTAIAGFSGATMRIPASF